MRVRGMLPSSLAPVRYLAVLTSLALVACGPQVPESGVGFESYPDYVRNREAALNGGAPIPLVGGPVVSGEVGAASVPTENRDSLPAGIARQTGEMDAVGGIPGAGASISDEQEFSAVSARETIASDKERLAQQRASYTQISPTALPQRDGTGGPNIVEYALRTTNRLGEPVYGRNNPFREKQSISACGKFASSDQAQIEFLTRGGPERDTNSLDPDGDGYACAWDPTPFRNAVN